MSTALREFMDADRKLEAIIRDEIDKAGMIEESVLMERVTARVAANPGLAETLARRQLYAECVRAF